MTPQKPIIGYVRKSIVGRKKTWGSGLGREAQTEAIQRLAAEYGGRIVQTYEEVERGKRPDRPELRKAMAHAKRIGGTVVVARLDRMARNARLFLELLDGGADVAFCDLPQVPPGPIGRLILTVLAGVAEFEVGMISERTKAALAEAKRRGVKLGGQNERCRNLTQAARERGAQKAGVAARRKADELAGGLRDTLAGMVTEDLSLAEMADRLNAAAETTATGKQWGPVQVSRVLARLGIEKKDGRRKEARK